VRNDAPCALGHDRRARRLWLEGGVPAIPARGQRCAARRDHGLRRAVGCGGRGRLGRRCHGRGRSRGASEQPAALNEQIAWTISDLAFAYYKAGKLEDCYGTADGQLAPYIGNVANVFDDKHKVMRALSYNADLCKKAIDKKLGAFVAATPCALAENGHGIPPAVHGGKEPACVVIQDVKREGEDDLECGAVSLVTKGAAPKTLEPDGGNLGDPSLCCNLGKVSFQKRGESWAMLVLSGGRDCFGGTASSSEQHVYELSGTTLKLVHRAESTYH
jgi:hypothetical protein